MTPAIARALTLVLALGLSSGVAADGDVNINIGGPTVVVAPTPAPVVVSPPVIARKPRLVLVPGTKIYTAPKVEFDVFVLGGKYWSVHHDDWFVSVSVGAPWTQVAFESVPVEIRRLPVRYYKVPPGHAKKLKHKDRDGDDDGPGRGHDKGCPPGLAKQGRC